MKFSYNWLRELSGTKLAPEKLAEVLTLRSFEIKEIKSEARDFMMDIDVLPNRASDCFSHIGIAREIAAITKSKVIRHKAKVQVKSQKSRTNESISIEVRDKALCPRYTALVVTDVKVGESPEWVKEKLNVCGVQSINNVVDITNYVMLETGQPLHAFDLDKLDAKRIIVRRAERGEKIVTLDDKKIDLNQDVLLIADANEPIALAGIKGGKKAEIDKSTKNIVLESANFSRQNIYQTSKRINLKTDASLRFGSGLDANLTEPAIMRAGHLIWEIAGGTIARDLIDVYPKKNIPKKINKFVSSAYAAKINKFVSSAYAAKIKLDLNYLETLLGIRIPAAKVKKILESLGFSVKGLAVLEVIVPTSRMDIRLPEDLAEEVGRVYGYEQIPAVLPMSQMAPAAGNESIFWEDKIKDALCCAGFSEVYNYSFIGEKEAEAFGFKAEDLLGLENPMSVEQSYLRPSLILGLIKNTAQNLNHTKEVMIFEVGKVFEQDLEKKMISGIMTGNKFYEAKGILNFLFNKAGIADVWYVEYQQTPEEKNFCWWDSKKCAEIKVNHGTIGYIGEISQKILNDFKVGAKIVYFDIFFNKLFKLVSEDREYRPISKYPEAARDIAVLVPKSAKADEVSGIINAGIKSAGSNLVRNIELFDIYEGKELPEGKKNFTFRIIYQSDERTLSSKEIDEIQEKIINVLERNPEWQVRR